MLRVAIFARVLTVMFVALAVTTLRVVTLVVERLELLVTLRVVAERVTAFIIAALLLV
jgi:hypothetical protein